MLVVVAYDISSNRRRLRVHNTLEGAGERVQRSVFECDLTAEELERLVRRLSRHLLLPDDTIRLYPLCESCRRRPIILPPGSTFQRPEVVIV